MDMDEARGIVEDARRRGVIRSPGEPELPAKGRPKVKAPGETILPDWLQEGILKPVPRE